MKLSAATSAFKGPKEGTDGQSMTITSYWSLIVLRAMCKWRSFPAVGPSSLSILARSVDAVIKYNPIICREPYNCLTVSYDGTVPLCCNDWYDTYRLGRVNGEESTTDLLSLYNSPKFRRYRNDLLIGNRVPMICYNCRERDGID